MNYQIMPFQPQYAKNFRALNIEWLEAFFRLEPHDEKVLDDPEKYIIDEGGHIFFVKEDEEILATVALVQLEEKVYELAKMAVTPAARRKKIGQKLMEHVLAFARNQNWHSLIIYSSRKLENAIHLYRKYGFKEIPLEEKNPYARGDIKMKLVLD